LNPGLSDLPPPTRGTDTQLHFYTHLLTSVRHAREKRSHSSAADLFFHVPAHRLARSASSWQCHLRRTAASVAAESSPPQTSPTTDRLAVMTKLRWCDHRLRVGHGRGRGQPGGDCHTRRPDCVPGAPALTRGRPDRVKAKKARPTTLAAHPRFFFRNRRKIFVGPG